MIRVDWTKRQTAEDRARDLHVDAAEKARAYLAATDWYVARSVETGKPMPEDVKAARAAARKTVSGE
jgi:hypothetical protein